MDTGDLDRDRKRDPRIPLGGGHTKEEYMALPDDLRVELIDGVFHAMAAPSVAHQTVLLEIARQIGDCIDVHGAPCFVMIAPSDVELGDEGDTVVQPDLYVRCRKDNKRAGNVQKAAPEFVVEVLSPSNQANDLWRKRELYKRHGVGEYWIVNPWDLKIYAFDFRKGSRQEEVPAEYTFDDEVPVLVSDGRCKVGFSGILQKIRRNDEIAGEGRNSHADSVF